MIKFRHIDSASTFNTTKFSARSTDDAYFTGSDKSTIINGSPTVAYDEVAFCRELKLIYTHGDLYNAAEADLSGYYTIIEADQIFATKTELSTKQDKISGSNGEVVYHNGTDVFTQTILNEGYVVNNQEDLDRCKNNSPSFEDVLNTWQKFSILNGVSNARPAEMNSWRYNNNTIIQPTDTESYVGFLSPDSYSSYDVTVRCYSTGADDGTIGLVAAYAKDSNGKEHTLSFLRTPGGTSNNGKPRWCAVLDYNGNIDATGYNQAIIVDNSNSTTYPASTINWNTPSIAGGTVINIVRNGNLFTARCSQFGSSVIDDSTLITLNLDTFAAQHSLLNLFKGSSKWGYSTFSQLNAQYENIAIADPSNYIIDVLNNKVYQYNSSTKTWVVILSENPINTIGIGRFSYNKTTGKLFYNNGIEVIEVANVHNSDLGLVTDVKVNGTSVVNNGEANITIPAETTVTQVVSSGTEIARVNGTSIYTPSVIAGLKQISNLDSYLNSAPSGDIVQYVGPTTQNYTHGYIYEKVGTSYTLPANVKRFQIMEASTQAGEVIDITGWYILSGETYMRSEVMAGGSRVWGYPLAIGTSQWYNGSAINDISSYEVSSYGTYINNHWVSVPVWENVLTGVKISTWHDYHNFTSDWDIRQHSVDSTVVVGSDGKLVSVFRVTDGVLTVNPTSELIVYGPQSWVRIDVQPRSIMPIHFVDASSINHDMSNIDATGFVVNDLVVIIDLTSTLYYYFYYNNGIVNESISGDPRVDVMFRYTGNGYKPISFPPIY